MNSTSSSHAPLPMFLAASLLPAQIQITAARTPGGEVTMNFKQGGHLSAITGRPFSALDSLEQTLRDGTHVLIKSDPVYRDAMGRTRTEGRQIPRRDGCRFRVHRDCRSRRWPYVLDPAHEIAHRIHVAVSVHPSPAPRPCLAGKPVAGSLAGNIATLNENLGAKIIDSLTVCGTRTTLTYPPGQCDVRQ
jgi:hypothetical protein